MASPLATIRKYDKVLLAVFGVLLMLSFLIADPLSMMTGTGGSGGGRPSSVPVTFKGGSLTDEQLLRMHRADVLADAYVERVKEAAQKANKSAQVGMFPYVDNPQFGSTRSEARLVNHFLLAKKAHEMGLSMSNEDIDDMLIKLADDAIEKDELKKIRQKLLAEDLGSAIIITERDLYAQLRINFLSQEVLAMVRNSAQPLQFEQLGFVMPSAMTLPPAEAWELFRRTARQAEVELLPLEVEKFIDEVKTAPTEAQKKELFEKYKDVVATPFSPEPGFARPHRIAFGYVRVDFQPFLDKAKAEVTEEAIRADYDEKMKKGELTVPVERKEEKPDDIQPEDAKPEDAKPDEGDKPEEKKDEKEPENQDAKEGDKPAEEAPPEEDDEQDELAEDDGQQPVENEEAAPEQLKDEEKKPQEGKPAGDKPADDEQKPDETKPDVEKPAAKKEETRVKTYEEMEDTIREQLAQKPAQDAQRAAMDELFEALQEYHSKYNEWRIEKEAAAADKSKAKEAAPAQPELLPVISGVLKKYDFQYKQTPLLDAFEIEEEEIGKASVGLPNQQQVPVSDVYMYDIKLYQAFPASEGFLRDTQYLLWKEADEPQLTADRKDVEEQLVKAAKMQEAFKLAKAEAERLAAQAREKGDESLRKSIGAVDKAAAIVNPQPFSWLSTGFSPGGMGMRLQPADIPEVPYPGEEFMQTVLDLQPGEVGVAADQPQKRVYVIRVVSQTPDEDILRQMFLTKGVSDRNVSQQYNSERLATLASWMTNVLEKEMQLKWNRTPQSYDRY